MLAHNPQLQHYAVLCYILFWFSRIRGVFRRVKQPRLRGDAWFFDTPVLPGFYAGPARAILQRYYLRMAWPFLLDTPALLLAYRSGDSVWLMWLMLLQVALIHGNHMLNVAAAQRAALPYAEMQEAAPVAAVGLSLVPRRLRDFSDARMEWAIGLITVFAFAALATFYRQSGRVHDAHQIFWVPAFYLYLQLGVLLLKRVIVEWSSPVPLQQTAEHLQAREAMRSYYLKMCDWNRLMSTAGIGFWPILLSAPAAWFPLLTHLWLWTWMAFTVAGSVWVEVLRKRVVDARLRAKPVQMPNLLGAEGRANWPVCFQPAAPMLILKGTRGYSLNLANTASYLGVAYLLGMAVLVVLAHTHQG